MLVPVFVDLAFQFVNAVGFGLQGLVLQQQYVGVRLVDSRGARQRDVPVEVLPVQYGHAYRYQPVAVGRIKKCSVDDTVGHCLDAYARCGVDAYHLYIHAVAQGSLAACNGHTVVVGVYQFGIRI